MWNCGLDCHEESIRICVMGADGKRVLDVTVKTETTDLEALLAPFVKDGLRVALEASSCAFPIYDRLKAIGCEAQVWSPKRMRAIAESKAKCDKNDARLIADLLRMGYHPRAVYVPTESERQIRDLLTARQTLVRSRVRIIQSARSKMVRRGRRIPSQSFQSRRGWKRVCEDSQLCEADRILLGEMRGTWIELTDRVNTLTNMLNKIAASDERAIILQSMPGVGPLTSLWYVVGLGDHNRFNNSREIGRYAGVIPTSADSGKVSRRGHITKEGKPSVRGIWIQAANSYLFSKKSQGQSLRKWFEACVKRSNRKIAIQALSRRLMVIAWHMLKENRPFRPEPEGRAA